MTVGRIRGTVSHIAMASIFAVVVAYAATAGQARAQAEIPDASSGQQREAVATSQTPQAFFGLNQASVRHQLTERSSFSILGDIEGALAVHDDSQDNVWALFFSQDRMLAARLLPVRPARGPAADLRSYGLQAANDLTNLWGEPDSFQESYDEELRTPAARASRLSEGRGYISAFWLNRGNVSTHLAARTENGRPVVWVTFVPGARAELSQDVLTSLYADIESCWEVARSRVMDADRPEVEAALAEQHNCLRFAP